ncbi:bacteriochlorophyll 4-vinyl reductase [Rhodobacter sp. CZR27]|uniref:bacteriochlorophyll 4-vinyl reductase n=1 Tax=Rhodobacter sp. CZR27 TaxID=2033869 RepID=UPI000BBE527D|nr:bacteriochlorophyll 4-vinyl reductase [Rhodobacter sp. CZR27]
MTAHDQRIEADPANVHRIGPNAILQLIPVLDGAFGAGAADRSLASAGVPRPGPDSGMLPEVQVSTLHRWLRETHPQEAPRLLREAGLATGDYILANRIPALAQKVIRALPAFLGARLLAAAIAKHSWTFAGSGKFSIVSKRPLSFEIARNPVVVGESSDTPLCHWHAAVFERLFSRLVWPNVAVRETHCCAQGAPACRFELLPRGN